MITVDRLVRVLALTAVLLLVGTSSSLAQCYPDPYGPGYSCPNTTPMPQEVGECPINTLEFLDQTTLSWMFPPGCFLQSFHDAARGDLECLRAGCSLATSCDSPILPTECGDPDTVAVDPAVPALEEGYWYLVRVTGGTWDSPGPQQEDYDPVPPDITGCP